jgi:hypothetical protein
VTVTVNGAPVGRPVDVPIVLPNPAWVFNPAGQIQRFFNQGRNDDADREETPTTNPEKFKNVRGRPGKENTDTGEVWEKDKLHKDHYEVYRDRNAYNRGTRDRDVWSDGRSKRTF